MKSPVTDTRNFFHGNVVDLAMRRWLSQDDPQAGWMAAHVDELLEEAETVSRETGDGVIKWRDLGDKERVRLWCQELVVRLEPILFDLIIPYEYQPALRFEGAADHPRTGRRAPQDCAARGDGPVHPQAGYDGHRDR